VIQSFADAGTQDLAFVPGNRFEALKGEQRGATACG
jgi:plasmid maintenance system killer protein